MDLHIKVRNEVKGQWVQKLSNLPPALNARLFKTNGGLCGAEIWYIYLLLKGYLMERVCHLALHLCLSRIK